MADPTSDPHERSKTPTPASRGAQDDLWDVRRTAEYLGLHEKTVYDMVARRELPVVRMGRLLRFDPRDVLRWVSARKEGC